LSWDEVELAWPTPSSKKPQKKTTSTTEPVVIEFPGTK